MSQPFVGEIRLFSGDYAPVDWALCNGQLLSINQYTTLFALIGTTYGGDGHTSFALPNMQGRIPVSQGTGTGLTQRTVGEVAGTETVTLLTTQLPAHNHPALATAAAGNVSGPAGNVVPAAPTGDGIYAVAGASPPQPTKVAMNTMAIGSTGGGQPHANLMPSLCLSFIIALSGVFPSRN